MPTFTAEVEEVRRIKEASDILVHLKVENPAPAKSVRIFIRDDITAVATYPIGRQFSIVVTAL